MKLISFLVRCMVDWLLREAMCRHVQREKSRLLKELCKDKGKALEGSYDVKSMVYSIDTSTSNSCRLMVFTFNIDPNIGRYYKNNIISEVP